MRKLVLASGILIFCNGSWAGESKILSAPNQKSSGCDLSIFKNADRRGFMSFFDQFKSAVAKNDIDSLANIIQYPLAAGGAHPLIQTAKEFKKHFKRIFTDKVRKAVAAQKAEDFFCNYEGVMIGNGEVWLYPLGRGPNLENPPIAWRVITVTN